MDFVHFIPPNQRRLALLAAQAETAPALVYGAQGSGKEIITQWIHQHGPRSAAPFVRFDETKPLAEQIHAAQPGTLLIPEVGTLNRTDQLMLLRFLKTRSIPYVGINHQQDVSLSELPAMICNTRIMATSSQNLEGRALGGLFDNELLRKLDAFRIEMPKLSERPEEFEEIAMELLHEITRELHKEFIRGFSKEALQALLQHAWPGNLRELRNVLRVAIARSTGDAIEVESLPDFRAENTNFLARRDEFEKIYLTELVKTFRGELDKASQAVKINKDVLADKLRKYGIAHDKSVTP